MEEEGDGPGGNAPSGGGNWKPLPPSGGGAPGGAGGDNARLFIQKGSKMNNGEFDEGLDEASPF